MAVNFFTVRATMTDGKRAEARWTFSDQGEAEKKFDEVCGPLCTEAWLISWTDHPSIRCKKQAHLRRHWTPSSGTDETPTWLCDVTTHEDIPEQTNEELLDTQFDWDTLFERAPDDSEVFLFIDPDQFTIDNTCGHFEVGFRKISFARTPRFPDYESCFRGLAFSCQWDSNVPIAETYAWKLSYRNVGVVELKRARRMAEMLEKIQSVEKSLPSPPRSFGEYVSLMAKGLEFNSDVMAFRRGCDTVETQSVGSYLPLNALELQYFVNQLIADRRQSGRAITPAEQNKRGPDVSVREDNAGSGDLSRRTTKFKSTVVSLGTLVLLYAVSWVFGQHGHTYNIEPAKQAADAPEAKPAESGPEEAASNKGENSLTPRAAEYKGRIEEVISEKGFSGRANVQGTGNTLILVGKLRPAEHAELLKFLLKAPPSVHVIDGIEYDDTSMSAADSSNGAKQPGQTPVVTDMWRCAEGQKGPFWENGKGRDPVCHEPVRQCPVLWFPLATQSPCPYKDPLGGPYTEDDLFVLKQKRNPRR